MLAQRIHELLPDLRVLPMSGYVDEAMVQRGVLKPGAPLLQKPFTSEELGDAIQEAMGRVPSTARLP